MQERESLSLLDCWSILKKRKWVIASIVVVITFFSFLATRHMAKIYRASVIILPIGSQSGGGLSVFASQVGGLMGLIGSGSHTESKKIMAILKSRFLAERVIRDLGILPNLLGQDTKESHQISESELIESAIAAILQGLNVSESVKDSTLIISYESSAPDMPVRILESYLKNLQATIDEKTFTISKANRLFVESQLIASREQFLHFEKQLNSFYDGRISNTDSKVDVPINVLKYGPEATMESTEKKYVINVPQQVYLNYLRMQKGVLSQLNGLLSSHYEMARIEEEKNALVFEIIDPPYMPSSPYKPNIKLIVSFSFVMAVFFVLFLVFLLEFILLRLKGGLVVRLNRTGV